MTQNRELQAVNWKVTVARGVARSRAASETQDRELQSANWKVIIAGDVAMQE
jgi:hypothetical protein